MATENGSSVLKMHLLYMLNIVGRNLFKIIRSTWRLIEQKMENNISEFDFYIG